MRPITAEEYPTYARAGELPFHSDPKDEDIAIFAIQTPMERTLAVFDSTLNDQIVATSGAFDFRLTVPGGADVPTAGVTAVGVWPTHRRRGLLTAMMRRQLTDYHDEGLPLAALFASESLIYGRVGYGLSASSMNLTIRPGGSAFLPS